MSRRRDKDASTAEVLSAARSLFLEQGEKATSIGQISSRAGVAKSLIFYHFGSKAALFTAVKAQLYADFAGATTAQLNPEDGLREILTEATRAYFAFFRANPDAARMQAWIFMEGHPPSPHLRAVHDLLVALVRQGQDQGIIRRCLEPDATIVAASVMIEQWFMVRHLYDLSDAAYLDTVVAMLEGGLLQPPSSSS